jgi:hypothetical protein
VFAELVRGELLSEWKNIDLFSSFREHCEALQAILERGERLVPGSKEIREARALLGSRLAEAS